jgi:hypothetical protein
MTDFMMSGFAAILSKNTIAAVPTPCEGSRAPASLRTEDGKNSKAAR